MFYSPGSDRQIQEACLGLSSAILIDFLEFLAIPLPKELQTRPSYIWPLGENPVPQVGSVGMVLLSKMCLGVRHVCAWQGVEFGGESC